MKIWTMEERINIVTQVIAMNIQTKRLKQGLTIEELAKLAGITKEYLIKIESGNFPQVRLTKIINVTKTLKIKLPDLFNV